MQLPGGEEFLDRWYAITALLTCHLSDCTCQLTTLSQGHHTLKLCIFHALLFLINAGCVMCSGVERGSAASHCCGGPVQGDGARSTAAAAAGYIQGRPRLGRPRRGGQGTHDELPVRCMPCRPLLHPGKQCTPLSFISCPARAFIKCSMRRGCLPMSSSVTGLLSFPDLMDSQVPLRYPCAYP